MPMASTPVGDGLDGPSQARTPCLERRPPVPSSSSFPINGEPEKVEGGRSLSFLLPRWRSPERQQAGLLRVKRQIESPHPLRQHPHHTPCIGFVFESNDEVIRISQEHCLPHQSRLHLFLEP